MIGPGATTNRSHRNFVELVSCDSEVNTSSQSNHYQTRRRIFQQSLGLMSFFPACFKELTSYDLALVNTGQLHRARGTRTQPEFLTPLDSEFQVRMAGRHFTKSWKCAWYWSYSLSPCLFFKNCFRICKELHRLILYVLQSSHMYRDSGTVRSSGISLSRCLYLQEWRRLE
jgi:hypothetical protein